MAKMKIYQSEFQAKTQQVMDVGGALSLPYEIAQAQGSAIDKLAKKIKEGRDKRKETKAQNEARKINNEINHDIFKKFKSYRVSKDEDDVLTFQKSINLKNYKPILKKYKTNKRVKELVAENIYQQVDDFSGKLYTQISANHLKETLDGHQKELIRIENMMGSPDEITSLRGYKLKRNFFNNPTNKEKYLDSEWKSLERKTELAAKQIYLLNGAKNLGATAILENQDEILKEFGPKRGEIVLDKIKNIGLSKQLSKDLAEERLEKATQSQQIVNYQTALERLLNKDDPDYESKLPTLDDLNDMWKAEELNSAQYQSLVDYYVKGDVVGGNQEVINSVLYQITIANRVEDLDEIENEVHFNPEWVSNLSLAEKKTIKSSFDAIKTNRTIWSKYKYYGGQVDTQMGKVQEFMSKYDKNNAAIASLANTARMDYEMHVGNGMLPENAYLRVMEQYAGENHMPEIFTAQQPMNINVRSYEEAIKKDPVKAFQKLEDELAVLAGQGKISMTALIEDISRLDFIKDLHNVRIGVVGKDNVDKRKGTDEL